MKKRVALILGVVLACMLSACGTAADANPSQDNAGQERIEPNSELDTADTNKVLVAYFSCTNNTETVAGYIAEAMPADLYEIVPQEAYSADDLDYGDSTSRATVEQNDSSMRPAISGGVENMDDYEVVFIGYPIWWGNSPKIVSTFLESYDFSNKTIIPFCTSGSSEIGSSATDLESLCSDTAVWISGERFGGSEDKTEIENWVNGLGL